MRKAFKFRSAVGDHWLELAEQGSHVSVTVYHGDKITSHMLLDSFEWENLKNIIGRIEIKRNVNAESCRPKDHGLRRCHTGEHLLNECPGDHGK